MNNTFLKRYDSKSRILYNLSFNFREYCGEPNVTALPLFPFSDDDNSHLLGSCSSDKFGRKEEIVNGKSASRSVAPNYCCG